MNTSLDIQLPKTLSFSQLSLYSTCPYKYKARYLDKLKEPSTLPTIYGRSAHKVMETVYKERNFELSHWLTIWPDIFEKQCKETRDLVISTKDQTLLLAKGYKHLTTIYGWLQKQDLLRDNIVQEWKFTSKYKNHDLTGVVDIIFDNRDSHLIADYKFGRGISEDHRYQLFLYAAFYSKITGVDNLKGLLIYPENIERSVYITFDKSLSDKSTKYFNSTYSRLIVDKEFKPKKNKYCNFCYIQKSCPLFKDFYVQD